MLGLIKIRMLGYGVYHNQKLGYQNSFKIILNRDTGFIKVINLGYRVYKNNKTVLQG